MAELSAAAPKWPLTFGDIPSWRTHSRVPFVCGKSLKQCLPLIPAQSAVLHTGFDLFFPICCVTVLFYIYLPGMSLVYPPLPTQQSWTRTHNKYNGNHSWRWPAASSVLSFKLVNIFIISAINHFSYHGAGACYHPYFKDEETEALRGGSWRHSQPATEPGFTLSS